MKTKLSIFVCLIATLHLTAQQGCMTEENLKKLDASWEKALLELDLDFLKTTLSEKFIWVHSHASQVDSKASLLASGQKLLENNKRNSKSRTQKDVEVIISGTTAIVTGYTTVERYNGTAPTTYNFMRTYVERDGKCYLLANHTMVVPEKEEK